MPREPVLGREGDRGPLPLHAEGRRRPPQTQTETRGCGPQVGRPCPILCTEGVPGSLAALITLQPHTLQFLFQTYPPHFVYPSQLRRSQLSPTLLGHNLKHNNPSREFTGRGRTVRLPSLVANPETLPHQTWAVCSDKKASEG